MDFKLEQFHRDVPREELIADLRRAYEIARADRRSLSFRAYANIGRYSPSTIAERFGTWNKALVEAGIDQISEKNISAATLFENLRQVWVAKGSQPVFRDMSNAPSRYNGQLYAVRFGSWRDALRQFIAHVKSDAWITDEQIKNSETALGNQLLTPKRTNRDVSLRMRFRILLRDNFKCQTCGASPATDPNVELQVDHVLPWSRGGETCENNLQTKCARCNLGKGNAFDR